MCLAVPGKIISIKGNVAVIDYNGEIREAGIDLVPEVKVNDWVLVSAKMIVQVVPEEEAVKINKIWDEADEFGKKG